MDKQKTQRIIGILVIIAFVIVLIPLFFGRTDGITEMSNAKSVSVPVPDQSNATPELAKNDSSSSEERTPDDNAILGSAAPTDQPTANSTPLPVNNTGNDTQNITTPDTAPTNASDDSQIKNTDTPLQTADTNNTSNPQEINSEPAALPTPKAPNDVVQKDTSTQISNATPVNDATPIENGLKPNLPSASSELSKPNSSNITTIKKHKKIISVKNHHNKIKPLNINSNELAKLNSTAWVVQMGNFKDKNNARRLADKLRLSGYKAFTKEIKAASGNIHTRVYIGPEFQRAQALHLAKKVAEETKMQGIVVSIKPLEI